jgi:hypothetical protein
MVCKTYEEAKYQIAYWLRLKGVTCGDLSSAPDWHVIEAEMNRKIAEDPTATCCAITTKNGDTRRHGR